MPELYRYQKETVEALLQGKHLAILQTGMGKSPIAMRWAQAVTDKTAKRGVLVVTTASKSRSGDFQNEADLWCGAEWRAGLTDFDVISWHMLSKWAKANCTKIGDYVFVFDEVAKGKSYGSGMGKAFREICRTTKYWAGFTATPGDKWIDFLNYMCACNRYKNKTQFLREHCIMQNFRGFPEITRYVDEDKLSETWRSIAYIPDTAEAERELPPETHRVVKFKAPKDYYKVIKTRTKLNGDLIESAPELCHYLRQLCFTKEKQEWLADFIENLGDTCVFFCNYIEEEDTLAKIAAKALPSGARAWRIDGTHHEIPTEQTIGPRDVVIAHYLSGGEALNLQFMRHWCAVSPNYSLSTSVQARGRIKRIKQKRPMFFHYLKVEKSIEEDIYKCLHDKRDFAAEQWVAELT